MKPSPRVRILPAAACLALAGGLLAVVVEAAAPATPDHLLTVHPDNPRVFRWHGRPLVLVGSGEHYGSVVNPDFDFRRYLATVQAAGLNQTRIFLGDYVEGPGSFGIADNSLAAAPGRVLAPWVRSQTPGCALGASSPPTTSRGSSPTSTSSTPTTTGTPTCRVSIPRCPALSASTRPASTARRTICTGCRAGGFSFPAGASTATWTSASPSATRTAVPRPDSSGPPTTAAEAPLCGRNSGSCSNS